MFGTFILKSIYTLFASLLSFATLAISSPTPTPISSVVSEHQHTIDQIIEKFKNLELEKAKFKFESQFRRTLKRGQSGNDVIQLQKAIFQLNPDFSENNITGHFGTYTEEAVRGFQDSNNLKPTGVFDDQTRLAFAEEIASKSIEEDSQENDNLVALLESASYSPFISSEPIPSETPNIDYLCTSNNYISTNDIDTICLNNGYITAPPTPSPLIFQPQSSLPPRLSVTPTVTPTLVKTASPKPSPSKSASPK